MPLEPTRSADVRMDTIAFEPGVYVQHASFRLPQSALIWRNNNNELPGVKVAAKGERFVAVSGPFLNQDQALDYLANLESQLSLTLLTVGCCAAAANLVKPAQTIFGEKHGRRRKTDK